MKTTAMKTTAMKTTVMILILVLRPRMDGDTV